MADSDVRKALIAAVQELLEIDYSVDANSIAWENQHFQAGAKDEWFRVSYAPNDPTPSTLGLGGHDRMTGFVQIDLNKQQGEGVAFFDLWLDRIRAKFYAGKAFTRSGQSAIIQTVGMSGGRPFENWFRKSVTISFRAELTRNNS